MNKVLILLLLTSCAPETRLKITSSLDYIVALSPPSTHYGAPVYTANQCIGTTINGQCQGVAMGMPTATCHGEMLNGMCIGPMF